MKKEIIITLPRYDYVTEYLSLFSKEIEESANKIGTKIIKIKDEKVNPEEFENVIKKLDYKMVILNGHGSEDSIEGHKNILIKVGINEELIEGRIVYARTCNSGKVLGKECMKKSKEGCFIGYNKPFQFYVNCKWIGNPLKDETAKLFLEPSNNVPISIIKGNSTFHANENSKRQILKNIKKILRNNREESFSIAESLWNNYEGQILIGNRETRLN